MILFYAAGASSLAPHILLREAKLSFSLEKVDLRSKRWSGGDYNEINPKSYVPALKLEEGDVLTECAVILQFIADLKPEQGLLPTLPLRSRYHALEWLNFIATEIHKNFITPERHGGVAANFLSKTAAGQQVTRVLVSPRLAYVDRALDGRSYLMGDSFTAPDAYLFVMLTWAQRLEFDLSSWRSLLNYFERIAMMPSVCEARAIEGPPHSLRD
jgi:glutathione S-transferase